MSYTVNRTDVVNNGTITVDDGTVNQQTSLSLPGRNTTSYGTIIAENFIHLLENFAKNTAPVNAIKGQLWYDTTVGVDQLKVYDGTNFVAAGGLKKALNEPAAGDSVVGDLWADTDNQQLYLFTGSGWVLVGPEFSQGLSTGTKPYTIIGTDNLEYTVVLIEVQAKPVAIISTKAFTPKAAITGFSTIQPGFNLSAANIEGAGVGKFFGTAQKAEALIAANSEVVSGSNFLRKDKANIADFSLTINNNDGLDVGNSATLNIGIEGQAGIISHKTAGANIDFRVNDQGATRTVMRIDSTTNVGINNLAPEEALDVTGNIKTSGELYVDAVTDANSVSTGAMIVKGGVGIAKKLYVGDDATFHNNITARDILPNSNNTYSIGTVNNRYLNIYANSFVGNVVGNITGTVSGASGTSNKLTSLTTFEMSGDVSAPSFTFDGQTGGTVKSFVTSVSNSFIASKTAQASSLSSDEFIFNRVSGTTGVFKINRDNLFNAIAKIPTGSVFPYAGFTAPDYWLLCDGSEVLRSTYPELFAVIGTGFGTPPSGGSYFLLPDMRGRLPLGKDNMGGTGANRVTASAADSVGGFGGDESKVIPIQNLPEHEHDLQGAAGAQYYAIRDVPGIGAGEVTAITYDAPTGAGQGSAISTSGGVNNPTVGQAQDVMNPYLTMNYIIYTGQTP
jgi:microcystin-dependent protein/cytoskeletal protein CcmA (bactofilin family)